MSTGSDRLAIAQAVKKRRKALGLTQQQLAVAAGIKSVSTVQNIEAATSESPYSLPQIARALQTTVAELQHGVTGGPYDPDLVFDGGHDNPPYHGPDRRMSKYEQMRQAIDTDPELSASAKEWLRGRVNRIELQQGALDEDLDDVRSRLQGDVT